RLFLVCLATAFLTAPLLANDWPQFRYDPGRTAASPHELPGELQLRWTRTLPTPRPAFPEELRLAYDASYEPVVLGNTMYVPSMVTDSVTALDTETGAERWRFFAEGPVRFAPVASDGKIYFVSDDGYLYCLDANDGSLLWKFRGLPEGKMDRKVIGHERLVSLFPARGGPVLADGIVYFAAGLWPTEGVFVHAVDAESGTAVWSNTEVDFIPDSNWDHGIGFVSGLTPQGYLAIVGDNLIVPCGTQLPASLDLKTGELHTYTMGWGGRVGLPKGTWFVAGVDNYLSHAGDLYDITRPSEERFADTAPDGSDYKPLLYPGGWTRLDVDPGNQKALDSFRQPVLTSTAIFDSNNGIVARSLTEVVLQQRTPENIPAHRAEDTYPDNVGGQFQRLWRLPSKLEVHIMAGSRLYAGGPGVVEAIETEGAEPQVVWRAEFEGTPQRMLAAAGKLFIVTTEGSILAFGAPRSDEPLVHVAPVSEPSAADEWTARATAVLEATNVRDGYALVLGIDSGRLVEELVQQSDLHVISVDADAEKVAVLRQRLDDLGVYGTRASVLVGDPVSYPFSPYLANLVVSETPDVLEQAGERTLAEAVYHTLRPYGGVAVAWGSLADLTRIEEIVQDESFPGADVQQAGDFVLLVRSGALAGSADWSHAEANAANTGASEDELRDPSAVLWYDSLRWHRQPGHLEVRVSGGRLLVLETGLLRATDVYTGRRLWETPLEIGLVPVTEEERRLAHRWPSRPRSLSPATELVAVQDAIYLSDGRQILVLDPATGQPSGNIELPESLQTRWANLRVHEDYLVGSSGAHIVCLNRHTRELLWQVEAARTALSLAVGGDRVFCGEIADPRRGEDETRDGRLFALDIATGERLWQREGGARLRYSPTLDIVVTPVGFFRGSDGELVTRLTDTPDRRLVVTRWGRAQERQPGFVAGQRLIAIQEEGFRDISPMLVIEIPTGKTIGEPLHWPRRGCTNVRASTNLVTTRYRSNSAWIDLDSCEITPFLGIRPGCQVNNNLFPANGVLNMPNLTGGCTCNFAPASVACVPAGAIRRGGAE
ncbi:MAG: hypothetical protein EA424_28130, partial [Planctomycetaceae bacterium]